VSEAVEICRQTTYHLKLPLTHTVQLTEPVLCELEVVTYEVVLVERRLMNYAGTQHLHTTTTTTTIIIIIIIITAEHYQQITISGD